MKQKSLQEQLLKSGLASSAKVKAVRTEKRKQQKRERHSAVGTTDEAKLLAQKAQEEKAEKDRLLNQLRKEEAERKQVAAQVKQLIDQNKLTLDDEGVKYNFTDDNRVKTLYLSEEHRDQLIKGRLAIVKSEQQYEVVPLAVARKIEQRDSSRVLVINEPEKEKPVDDPYAGFEVPDDLMW